MQCCLTVLSKPMYKRLAHMFVFITQRVWEWYSEQAKTVKTASSARAWLLLQLSGGFMECLRDSAAQFLDGRLLEDVGGRG